nr:hypothetical protein [Tanacetum cinerariifolium]
MGLNRLSRSVKSENADKAPYSGSGLFSDKITDSMRKKFSLEQPTLSLSGEARYLTPLWVSGNEESRDELRQSDPSDSKTIIGFEARIDNNDNQPTQRMLQDKIRAVLKLLTFP